MNSNDPVKLETQQKELLETKYYDLLHEHGAQKARFGVDCYGVVNNNAAADYVNSCIRDLIESPEFEFAVKSIICFDHYEFKIEHGAGVLNIEFDDILNSHKLELEIDSTGDFTANLITYELEVSYMDEFPGTIEQVIRSDDRTSEVVGALGCYVPLLANFHNTQVEMLKGAKKGGS